MIRITRSSIGEFFTGKKGRRVVLFGCLTLGLILVASANLWFVWRDTHQDKTPSKQATAVPTAPAQTPTTSSTAGSSPTTTQSQPTAAQPTPQPTPTQPPQKTQPFSVSLVGLNAHIETHDFYVIAVSIGSSLNTTGTCKITFSKDGSQPVVFEATIQPDPKGTNGYSYWCQQDQMAARYTNGSWQYYMDPGTWTVTATITSSAGSVSSSGTVNVLQLTSH